MNVHPRIPLISRGENIDRLCTIIIEEYHEQGIVEGVSQGTPAEGLLSDGLQQVSPPHRYGLRGFHSA